MLSGPCNKFPFNYVGSGRVAAVKWHLRHKLSDWLRHTFSFSHTHTDTPSHKHTPSILGTVGEIYSGNNLFVAQSDYKKGLRTFINYISYIQWNMVLYLNNCRRQLWYFDSLPRTNGFSPSLACWVDLSWWKPNLGYPFHRVFVLEDDEMLPQLSTKPRLRSLGPLWKGMPGKYIHFIFSKQEIEKPSLRVECWCHNLRSWPREAVILCRLALWMCQ